MKNKIFVAILLSASFTFAQYDTEGDNLTPNSEASSETVQEEVQETSSPTFSATEYSTTEYRATPRVDESDPYYHAHKGFYFSTSAGFTYAYLRHSVVSDKKVKNHKYTGFMLYEETRLGGSINNILSIYGLFGTGVGTGTYEYENDDLKTDANNIRFAFGLGLDFYPIQDKESPIYGLFVGFSSGLLLDAASYESKSNNDDGFINVFYRLEVGRDWWFSKRWCFGVALNYTFGTMSLGDDDDVLDNYRNHSFGLSVRIAH